MYKLPNGQYGDIGYADEFLKIYTEQDIIDEYIRLAKQKMSEAQPPEAVIAASIRYTLTKKDLEKLKEAGYTRPYSEMVKYIPRKPLHQQYAECNFATYGKCPACGETVQNGIGIKEEKCPNCEQALDWRRY